MPAEDAAGVGGGEDTHEMAVLGDQRAPDVLSSHVLEHVVERLARIDDVRIGLKHVANEQLVFRRQAQIRVERPLQVAVRQHADQGIAPLHRQMPDLMTHHDLACVQEAVVDVDDVRKRRHNRVRCGHVVHGPSASNPGASDDPGRRTRCVCREADRDERVRASRVVPASLTFPHQLGNSSRTLPPDPRSAHDLPRCRMAPRLLNHLFRGGV
jgi:hypothetical protein